MKRYVVRSGTKVVYSSLSQKKAKDRYDRACNESIGIPIALTLEEELYCNEAMISMRESFKGMLGCVD
ncbi:hypothetical protein [Pseudoalteromonas marina]|uniref:hypothetical protein n=1 Tax=Pseudoalteromonas marina TaxID=267375 RepID=UPI003C5A22B0